MTPRRAVVAGAAVAGHRRVHGDVAEPPVARRGRVDGPRRVALPRAAGREALAPPVPLPPPLAVPLPLPALLPLPLPPAPPDAAGPRPSEQGAGGRGRPGKLRRHRSLLVPGGRHQYHRPDSVARARLRCGGPSPRNVNLPRRLAAARSVLGTSIPSFSGDRERLGVSAVVARWSLAPATGLQRSGVRNALCPAYPLPVPSRDSMPAPRSEGRATSVRALESLPSEGAPAYVHLQSTHTLRRPPAVLA
jgi:hypothetical protein